MWLKELIGIVAGVLVAIGAIAVFIMVVGTFLVFLGYGHIHS